MWDKALPYCRQAGAKALARSAYREAVGYLEQALEALAHLPPDRPTLEQAVDLRCDLAAALAPLPNRSRRSPTCATRNRSPRVWGITAVWDASTAVCQRPPEMQTTNRRSPTASAAHAIATALEDMHLQRMANLEMG